MKKFVIISLVLLIIGGSLFGFALKHYLDVTRPAVEPASEPVSQETTAPSEDAPSPTEIDLAGNNPLKDNGIFSANYDRASELVARMSTEEMVGQMLLGVCSEKDSAAADVNRYSLGGFYFTSSAFPYNTSEEISEYLSTLSATAKTSPILAVREEGGYHNSISDGDAFSDVTFLSPRNNYAEGGLQQVERDEIRKAEFLKTLGFNVNLAPVIDLPSANDQMMYSRSLSDDVQTVSAFAEYCAKFVQAKGISVTLKHFPGYGTVSDEANYLAQATGEPVIDERPADEIRSKDYTPFKAGAEAGAHFIMVSNVLVKNIDPSHTAALSPVIHRELRDTVGFTGLIITNVLDEEDYSAYADGNSVAVAAVLAGNDMLLVRDYQSAYTSILDAVNSGVISPDILRQVCTRIIAYKYTAGILK